MKKTSLWRSPLDLISRYRPALMGAAALFILFYHCWIRMNLQFWILAEIEARILSVGFIGVEIFLFLSGMGLTYAIKKYPSVWTFYGMRIRRLVFPYVVAAALCTWERGQGFREFLLLATGIAHVTKDITSLLWYVPAAAVLYALFPLYHRFLIRSRNETAFVLNSIGAWLILTLLFQPYVRADLWVFLNRIPTFLLGILAGRLRQTRSVAFERTHWWGVWAALILGFQLCSRAMRGRFVLFPEVVYSLEAGMFGIALMLILAALFEKMEAFEGRLGQMTRGCLRALSNVGRFSLELYCIHQWLYVILFRCLEGRISYLQMNFVTIPAGILAAWLLFRIHQMFWKGIDMLGARAKANRK